MSKFDMLTALDESGLDDIALKILDYLNPKELLPVFQGTSYANIVLKDSLITMILTVFSGKQK